MDKDKQRQEVSLIGRIFSIEALLLLMGVASLFFGIVRGVTMNIFWGLIIIPGVFLLMKIRKKDWKKHWEELEAEQQAAIERAQQKSRKDEHQEKRPNGES